MAQQPRSDAGPPDPKDLEDHAPSASWALRPRLQRILKRASLLDSDSLRGLTREWSRRLREIREVRRKTGFLLWPTNKHVELWQLWLSCTLVYTFVMSPFQVAFLPSTPWPIFAINRMIDLCLICDMSLQFFLAYQIDETHSRSPGLWITNLSQIRQRYLRGWFAIDLISLLSGISEIMEFLAPLGKSTQVVRFARTIRLVRTLGMARSSGSSRQRLRLWLAEQASFVVSEMARWVAQLMLTAHMVACVWGFVAQVQEDDESEARSWLTAVESSKGIQIPRDSPLEMYVLCLYWAFTTLLTIGYGDITPVTQIEFATVTVVMVVGATAWTIFMASVCAVMTSLDADRLQHGLDLEHLEKICTDQMLPVDLTRRLRAFLARSRRMKRRAEQQQLMSRMSPALQSEMTMHMTERLLVRVPFFRGVEPGFVSAIAEALHMQIFPPKEWIAPPELAKHVVVAHETDSKAFLDSQHCPRLTLLETGIAVRGGLLCAGSCWHQDFMLEEPLWRDLELAQSLVYCSIYTMDRQTCLAAASKGLYPLAEKAVKNATLSLALSRLMVRASKLAPQRNYQLSECVKVLRGERSAEKLPSALPGPTPNDAEQRLERLLAMLVTAEQRTGSLIELLATALAHRERPTTSPELLLSNVDTGSPVAPPKRRLDV
jgi:hypothetical protein